MQKRTKKISPESIRDDEGSGFAEILQTPSPDGGRDRSDSEEFPSRKPSGYALVRTAFSSKAGGDDPEPWKSPSEGDEESKHPAIYFIKLHIRYTGVVWATFCVVAHCVSTSHPSTKQLLKEALWRSPSAAGGRRGAFKVLPGEVLRGIREVAPQRRFAKQLLKPKAASVYSSPSSERLFYTSDRRFA